MKIATLPTILFLAACFAGAASAADPAHWVVAWGASPAPQLADETQMRTAKLLFDNQTIRVASILASNGDGCARI